MASPIPPKPPGRTPVKVTPPTVVGGGRGRGGMTPPPGMMYGPNDRLIPIPKKGGGVGGSSGDGRRSDMSPKGDGGSRPRGTSPAPGYSGGKPKVSMTPIRDGRGPSGGGKGGPRGMKSGGMVKGKK